MRLSFTNILTTKKARVVKGKDGYSLNESFSDPIRWELATGYDFEEARRHKYREDYERKPIMDTYSYLVFSPLDWFSLSSKMYFSMYGDGVTRNDSGMTFRNKRWGSWSISYDIRNKHYTYRDEMKRDKRSDMKPWENKKSQRLVTNTLNLHLTRAVDLYFKTEDDIITGHNLSWEGIIGYKHQCFHILGAVERDGRDTSFRVYFEFPGFSM